MKIFICLAACLFTALTFAQDPKAYLDSFDAKVYSLKNKGVQDFTVDIESSKLTKQMNDQQLFGKIEELLFRVYWTARPERVAIEVIGLPEGFKEVKESLKAAVLPLLDNVIPPTTVQRFAGHKLSQGEKQREILAKDPSGIATIPSYSIFYDEQERLREIVGHRPVGVFSVKPLYEKESFSDGKWVLKEQTTLTSDNGQNMKVVKKLNYTKTQGVGVVEEVEVETEYSSVNPEVKAMKASETISFKNYKINEGVALKYFLGEGKNLTDPAKPD